MLANRLAYYEGATMKAITQDVGAVGSSPQGSVAPPPSAPAASLDQLRAMGPAAPGIGQNAGLFSVAEMK